MSTAIETGVLVSVVISSTNSAGSVALHTTSSFQSSATSAILPVTTTDAQGNTVETSTLLPVVVLTATDSRGSIFTTTSALPIVEAPVEGSITTTAATSEASVLTTTDHFGNDVALSGTSGQVVTTTDARGRTATLTYTPQTAELPNGQMSTITSVAVVGVGGTFATSGVPLTTIFTPATECSAAPWMSVNSTQGTITCTQFLESTLSPSCFPSSFTAGAGRLYSPGVCPENFLPVASWTTGQDYATTSICCPSGMSYVQLAGSCGQTLGGPQGTSLMMAGSTVDYTGYFTAFAPTLAVAWASSDLGSFTPASAPVLTSSSGSANLTTHSSRGGSLTKGAIAGIGVGCALAALALLALGVWLFLRRKQSRGAGQEDHAAGTKAELPGRDAEKKVPTATELGPDGEIFETSGHGKPAELEPGARYELEGDFHGHEAGGQIRPSA